MKDSRFAVLAMILIFAMALAGCAGEGQSGGQQGQGATGSSESNNAGLVGTPGAQQTDMPGTGDSGAPGGNDTTGSGSDTIARSDSGNTDTGVSGSGSGQGTGADASSGTSGGTSSTTDTTGGGSGTTNTGGSGTSSDLSGAGGNAAGSGNSTSGAGNTAAGSGGGNFMGRWNFDILEGCTVGAGDAATSGANSGTSGSGSGSNAGGANANASESVTMNCQIDGNSYVIELSSGAAGNATTLQEWAQGDMGDDAGEMAESSVGNFDAVSGEVPAAMLENATVAGATCAYRTYVWGMGNASGAGNSGNSQGNSGANDNNAKNLLVVTVYQTSGDTCEAQQVSAQFLQGFQGGEGNGNETSGADNASATPTP